MKQKREIRTKKIVEKRINREERNKFNSLIVSWLEFLGSEFPSEMAENEIPLNSKVPIEVRAARNKEVRQTPQRKPTTQIWHGKELPICRALCDTTFSRDFCPNGSIFFSSISLTSTSQNQKTQISIKQSPPAQGYYEMPTNLQQPAITLK